MAQAALVTGATGFIATHLITSLEKDPALDSIYAIDKSARCEDLEKRGSTGQKTLYKRVDLGHTTSNWVRPFVGWCVRNQVNSLVIYHLAARPGIALPRDEVSSAVSDNIQATANLLELPRVLLWAGLQPERLRLVFASSCAAEKQAEANLYGTGKRFGELMLSWYWPGPCTSLRFANVYGRQRTPKGVIGRFVAAASAAACATAEGAPLPIDGDGQQVRDFIHVDDIVLGLRKAAERVEPIPKTYRLATEVPTSILQLVEQLQELTAMPLRTALTGGPAGVQDAMSTGKIPILPEWQPTVDLRSGLRRLLRR